MGNLRGIVIFSSYYLPGLNRNVIAEVILGNIFQICVGRKTVKYLI